MDGVKDFHVFEKDLKDMIGEKFEFLVQMRCR